MRRLLTSAVAMATAFSLAAQAFALSVNLETDARVEARRASVDLACMQTAVEKRDNAMIAALDAYHASWKAALQTRRDELKTAWGTQDKNQREDAIRAAWKKFRESKKSARDTFRTARKNAWKTFKTDARACRGQGSIDASLGASIDAQD